MFGTVNYEMFLLSGIILNIIPGSDTIYILSRSISAGRKGGILSVLGVSSGILMHTIFASLGLSVLLAKSAFAFNLVKYAGVIYLVYLGIATLLNKKEGLTLEASESVTKPMVIYTQGFLTNLLNPKVALFFLAFLPQFVDTKAGLGPIPFIFLGCTFVTTGTIWCLFLAIFSSSATQTLRNNQRVKTVMNKLCGFVYLALGLNLIRAKVS